MIIIPTEKKFDWKKAPIALFTIVFINVLVFFVYQSGDQKKLESALLQYMNKEYLDDEWPIIEEYFTAIEDQETLNKAVRLKDAGNAQDLHLLILRRSDLFDYLILEGRNHFYDDYYISWMRERTDIQHTFNSLSVYALGLKPHDLNPLHFLTYQFLHGSLMHLLGNMIFIIIFGFAVEASIGHWRFTGFYLLSGIVGGGLHAFVTSNGYAPLVGASGALAGLMAMYLAIFRFQKIEFFYWVLFFVGYFRAPALAVFPLYLLKEIYLYISSPDASVAFMAHAGGLIAGAACIVLSLKFDKNLLDEQYIEEDQSLDPKQKELADIYAALDRYQYAKALNLIAEALKRYPADFDLKWLRYRICRLLKNEQVADGVLALITTKRLTPNEALKVERAWVENSDLHEQLDKNTLVQLAMELSAADCLSTAEQLFEVITPESLREKLAAGASAQSDTQIDNAQLGAIDPTSLGILAKKLSNGFAEHRQHSKQAKYQSIAKQLLGN